MQPPVHPRATTGTFVLVVTVVTALGALLTGVVLLLSNAPTSFAVGAFLAFLPVGPLVACFMWLDRYEPEPRHLLAMGLGWGAFVATTLTLVAQLVQSVFFTAPEAFMAAIFAPVSEEAGKGLFILLLLWFRRADIDGVLDGIVYAGMVGIGFAFTENILYLGAAFAGDNELPGGFGSAVTLFIMRCVFSPFAHPLFTAFVGIGVGIAVTTKSSTVRFLAPVGGYCVAVLAHGLWNGSLVFASGGVALLSYLAVMVPAFVVMSGFAIWSRSREGKMLTAALTDCAQRGIIPAAEVPWLTRLPARRQARRHARQVGGVEAQRALARYQTEAIELGFLHDRFLRGTPPRDFVAIGQYHVDMMARLRPSLTWPVAKAAPTHLSDQTQAAVHQHTPDAKIGHTGPVGAPAGQPSLTQPPTEPRRPDQEGPW